MCPLFVLAQKKNMADTVFTGYGGKRTVWYYGFARF